MSQRREDERGLNAPLTAAALATVALIWVMGSWEPYWLTRVENSEPMIQRNTAYKTALERDAARAAVGRYKRFMNLPVPANAITQTIRAKGLTPGFDWRGCSKSLMAEYYAHGDSALTDAVVARLEEIYAKRPTD